MLKTFKRTVVVFGLLTVTAVSLAHAGPLMDRIKSGQPVRIGFAAEPPFAYPGDHGEPLGFANAIAVGVLKKMGYTNIEPVVTDWGAMIPGLVAKRLDIVTGGMYILSDRCANMDFSNPIGRFGDAFIVPKGNPKGIKTYKDVVAKHATIVTGVGYNNIGAAKKEGVPDDQVMKVPGVSEILAAVKSGRADAGALPALEAKRLVDADPSAIDATDSSALPDWTLNWIGIGFRHEDDDFKKAFNAALSNYLGSPEMLAAVKPFEYTKANLPGDAKTDWICKNR
ncbi:transporter substrate-binding domain-containing protein [Paraburkholderia aspalathi]|uniref:Amino acid ABC transporter substrate-binding protein, PAAT family n=1 Tax=Paraburkholderia aspalathi TaxID=1324617 RepID=A0A1I7BEJ1_9BURK|nr:transporter substrate-binding domain-containing protein [Paraburkholderia aspalathi]SFT85522.1 amino acid ABC transporter substrate-binding protein, PAAT family [Paraburkholderia aspalathi]